MSIREEFAGIIEQRIAEDERCLPELPDYWETSPVIKSEIELFSRNLQEGATDKSTIDDFFHCREENFLMNHLGFTLSGKT